MQIIGIHILTSSFFLSTPTLHPSPSWIRIWNDEMKYWRGLLCGQQNGLGPIFIEKTNSLQFTCWLLQVWKFSKGKGMLSKNRNLKLLVLGQSVAACGGQLTIPKKNEFLISFWQHWKHPNQLSFSGSVSVSMSYALQSTWLWLLLGFVPEPFIYLTNINWAPSGCEVLC